MQPDPPTTAGPAVRLALATLFGEPFLERAQPELVASLERTREDWADLLIALWGLRLENGSSAPTSPRERRVSGPAAPAPQLASTLASFTQFEPPPPDPFGVPGDGVAGPPTPAVEPVAGPAGNGGGAVPAPSLPASAGNGGTPVLEVFDPAVDELVARYAAKPRTRDEVRALLVDLLVEKTGYPPETFEGQLDLEADLGIDTVKQVEVMAIVRQTFQLTVDENFRMRDYTTLDAATDYIVERLEAAALPPGSSQPEADSSQEDESPARVAAMSNAHGEAKADDGFTTL